LLKGGAGQLVEESGTDVAIPGAGTDFAEIKADDLATAACQCLQ
jgi:hypothetical protein